MIETIATYALCVVLCLMFGVGLISLFFTPVKPCKASELDIQAIKLFSRVLKK